MKNKIILLSGDPNSINSEIIYKTWKKLNNSQKKRIFLIANYNLIREQFKKLKYYIRIKKVKEISDTSTVKCLKIIDINFKFKDSFKTPKNATTKFIIKSLNLGHKLALKNDVTGLINCAIDKKLINKKGYGVTEYLASKCGLQDNSEAMLIYNNSLSVSPLTTHIDIKNISSKIVSKTIISKVNTINNWYKKVKKRKPKIGLLGLNPHNAEYRKNSEEKKIIIPSIRKMKNSNIDINGPLIADTVFIKDYKKYDVLVGMYHDQVLAPFKSIFKFDAINVTLGLKYLRVSPDHGTAKNLIKKNKANPRSLIKCINFIDRFKK